MIKDNAIENRNVICLGVPTVGLGISITRKAKKMTIVDIDDELLQVLVKEANKWDAQIEVISHDLRLRLPSEIHNQYNTFVIDPVYTLAAYELFLSRGVQALKRGLGGIGYFPLPKYMKNNGRLFDSVLKIIRNMHFEHSIIDKFIETDVPLFERLVLERTDFTSVQPWRVASLVVVRTTASTRPIVRGRAKKSIYPSKVRWIKLPYSVARRTTAYKLRNNLILNSPQNVNYIFNEVAWFILLHIDKEIDHICSEIENSFVVDKEYNVRSDVKQFLEKLEKDGTIRGPIPNKLIKSLSFRIRKKRYTKPSLHKIPSLSVLGGLS